MVRVPSHANRKGKHFALHVKTTKNRKWIKPYPQVPILCQFNSIHRPDLQNTREI